MTFSVVRRPPVRRGVPSLMGMVFDVLAAVVMVVHLAFILFVAAGALLAWRWPRLVWLHVPAVVWGVGIIVIGYECPLTPLEKWLRRRAGDNGYEGGFVDRYVEDVIYPEEFTPLLRALAAVMIVAGYVRLSRSDGLRRRESIQTGRTWPTE
jgi:hypothetical protein